jgi:hypothetical protein
VGREARRDQRHARRAPCTFATSRSVSVFAFSTDLALNYVAATLFLRGRRTDRARSSDPEMGNIFLWKVALTGTILPPGRALDYLQQLL